MHPVFRHTKFISYIFIMQQYCQMFPNAIQQYLWT